MAATSSAAPTVDAPGGDLATLLDSAATYPRISALLDGLSSAARLEQVLAITGKRVGKLYEAVKDGPPIGVDDFFPKETPDGQTVIFEGRNSLPAFTRFQKRFCRGKDGVIVGYNHQTMSFVTGPGFFVLTEGDATHPGEILFDYTLEPAFFPTGWPPYKKNTSGLSSQVYGNMKDYCRRVAKGVIVGAAFKNGVAQGAFFTLTLP